MRNSHPVLAVDKQHFAVGDRQVAGVFDCFLCVIGAEERIRRGGYWLVPSSTVRCDFVRNFGRFALSSSHPVPSRPQEFVRYSLAVEERREPAGCVLLHRRQGVSVNPERHFDFAVPETTLHDMRRDAG